MNPILFYTFLGIFIATAILTLLSLPDWIKISTSYKKVLFTSLIVEVIGCIILLFKQEMQIKYTIEPDENWVAMHSSNAEIIQPTLKLNTETFMLGMAANEANNVFLNNSLDIKKNGDKWTVYNENNQFGWGTLSADDFRKAGFYNSLEAWQKEIPSSDNYKVIKFISSDGNKTWTQKGSFPIDCPLVVEVYSTNETAYRIKNLLTNSLEFDSGNESQNVIDIDHRKLHFLTIDDIFYLIRITQADLSKNRKENYIHFMVVKLEPQLN